MPIMRMRAFCTGTTDVLIFTHWLMPGSFWLPRDWLLWERSISMESLESARESSVPASTSCQWQFPIIWSRPELRYSVLSVRRFMLLRRNALRLTGQHLERLFLICYFRSILIWFRGQLSLIMFPRYSGLRLMEKDRRSSIWRDREIKRFRRFRTARKYELINDKIISLLTDHNHRVRYWTPWLFFWSSRRHSILYDPPFFLKLKNQDPLPPQYLS